MDAPLFLLYTGPPVLALILSGKTRSRVAKWMLRVAAILLLIVFGLTLLANADCIQAEFTFSSCDRLPDGFGDAMGPIQILFVVSYVTAGPVILVIAAILDWWSRRS